ncbi:hypothetical protein MMC24_004351 [Lignoscripta atroalba]|nr:hypothetical protein [Lignoscripta atroalba]
MKSLIFFLQVLGFARFCLSQSSCTSANASPVDDGGDDVLAANAAANEISDPAAILGLIGRRRMFAKRQVLSCLNDAACVSIAGEPLCLNPDSGEFLFSDGTRGNLVTGDYTLPDGSQGNFNTGVAPTSIAAGVTATSELGDVASTSVAQSDNTPTVDGSATSSIRGLSATSEATRPSLSAESTFTTGATPASGATNTESANTETVTGTPTEGSSTSATASSASMASSASVASASASPSTGASPRRHSDLKPAMIAILGFMAFL